MTVVVDASIALKWVVPQEHTEEALALRDRWQRDSERIIAPPLFRAEVTNVVRQYVRRGNLRLIEAPEILDVLLSSVASVEPEGLYTRALSITNDHGLGAVYDSIYLALAEFEDCDMWTADLKFARGVQDYYEKLQTIG